MLTKAPFLCFQIGITPWFAVSGMSTVGWTVKIGDSLVRKRKDALMTMHCSDFGDNCNQKYRNLYFKRGFRLDECQLSYQIRILYTHWQQISMTHKKAPPAKISEVGDNTQLNLIFSESLWKIKVQVYVLEGVTLPWGRPALKNFFFQKFQ